jgi:NADH-quinone oxidoreductase subunit L
MIITISISLFGMGFAYFKYQKDGKYFGDKLKNRFCYKLLANQYYFPHILEAVIHKPYLALSKFSWKEIDMKIIDTIVDGIASGIRSGGQEARVIQTSNLSKALKLMVSGIVVLLMLVLIFGSIK